MSLKVFIEVGDKVRVGEMARRFHHCKMRESHTCYTLSKFMLKADCDAINDDNYLWQEFRKRIIVNLTCICCGSFESIGGRDKHNLCGGCGNALYCSKECQNEHWGEHKNRCKEIRKLKKTRRNYS